MLDLKTIFAIMDDDVNGNYVKLGEKLPQGYHEELWNNIMQLIQREANNEQTRSERNVN